MTKKEPVLIRRQREEMDLNQLARIQGRELLELYRTMFDRNAVGGHGEYARRRIAWRLQADSEGGLPESARRHALEIARGAKLRSRVSNNLARRGRGLSADQTTTTHIVEDHDSRLPMPGSVIVKKYRHKTIIVRVLDYGFEYDNRRFGSLSAIAQDITGTKWNGFMFFGLAKGGTGGS